MTSNLLILGFIMSSVGNHLEAVCMNLKEMDIMEKIESIG